MKIGDGPVIGRAQVVSPSAPARTLAKSPARPSPEADRFEGPPPPGRATFLSTPATGGGVDPEKLAEALEAANSSQELLAMLQGPGLGPAEKGALVAAVIRDPERRGFLLGEVELTVTEQAALARAMVSALESGVIAEADLLLLADADASGMGPSRLVQMLALDPANRTPGGAVERLGRALWDRAEAGGETADRDRAAVALAFTSSSELMARNLTTPEARLSAFIALVNHLDSDGAVPRGLADANPGMAARYREHLLASLGRLFVAHGSELARGLTRDGEDEFVVLARFFADVALAPEARTIGLDHHRQLSGAIESTLRDVTRELTAAMVGDDPPAQELAARQLGRLAASVDLGAAFVLDRHAAAVAEGEERVEQISGPIGDLLGALVPELGRVADAAVGAVAGELGDAIASALVGQPDRPEVAQGILHDELIRQVAALRDRTGGVDVVSAFEASWAAAQVNIRQELGLDFSPEWTD